MFRSWSAWCRLAALLGVVAAACAFASAADAAELIGRDATDVQLSVRKDGVALITFTSQGRLYHVLARGAVNARLPNENVDQVKFELDYGGGFKFFKHEIWQTFEDACRTYDGPQLYGLVAACRAPDGSYWAVQAWQQPLPDLGFSPWLPEQGSYWLELSHWSGPLAELSVVQGWVYGRRFNALFGRLTYRGSPVYGFGTTRTGQPTDTYGQLVYLDTLDSVYGPGWRRENSFVAHNPSGAFCYGMFPRDPTIGGYKYPPGLASGTRRGPATGSRYRMIASGPGVTPLVAWEGPGLHSFNAADPGDYVHDLGLADLIGSLGSNLCTKGLSRRPEGWLVSLQDSFRSLSSQWARDTSGGTTMTVGARGLVVTIPAGRESWAELTTRSKKWNPHDSPAFIDLGPNGVSPGATLSLVLYPTLGSGANRAFAGVRIADGRLQVVRRTLEYDESEDDVVDVDRVAASVPYNRAAMRWLWIWGRNGADGAMDVEVWYAATGDGHWTRLGAAGDFHRLAHVFLQLRIDGDGSRASTVNLAGLNDYRLNLPVSAFTPTASPSTPTTAAAVAPPRTSGTLSVSRTGNGNGTVRSNPAGIDCGSVCSHTYGPGTRVTLTATPASGSLFTGWSGACTGADPCTLIVNRNLSVVANFEGEPTGTATGTVKVAGSDFKSGAVPYGALVNVTDGTISVRTRVGTAQITGRGQSAVFLLRRSFDSGKPLDVIVLQGGRFDACTAPKRKTSSVSATKPPKNGAVRGVRTHAKGKYAVKGKYSFTTVRGTIFTVVDRCDGTLTQVTQGRVDVLDTVTKKHVLVPAPRTYLARKP